MKHPKLLGALLALAVILSACSPAATSTPITIQTLPPVSTATKSVPGGENTATPSSGTTGTPAASTTGTAVVPVTGSQCTTVTVQVSGKVTTGTTASGTATSNTAVPGTPTPATGATSMPGTPTTTVSGTSVAGTPTTTAGGSTAVVSGPYLVDCKGMTLYINKDDASNSGASICTGACAAVWPPFTIGKDVKPSGGEGVTASMLGTITRPDGSIQVTYNGWALYLFSGDKQPGDTNGLSHGDNWVLISPSGEPISH